MSAAAPAVAALHEDDSDLPLAKDATETQAGKTLARNALLDPISIAAGIAARGNNMLQRPWAGAESVSTTNSPSEKKKNGENEKKKKSTVSLSTEGEQIRGEREGDVRVHARFVPRTPRE